MSRNLIDRDALIASIPKTNVDIFEDCRNCSTLCDWQVKELIDKMPTIDAVEVVHGEWMEENHRTRSSIFYCSVCHRNCYDIQPTRIKGWVKRCRYAYCPNCGARMDANNG